MPLCLAPLVLAVGAPLAMPAPAAPVDEACPAAPRKVEATHFYPADTDARAAMDDALADAPRTGHSAVLVFGADWCHDSVALARVLIADAFRSEFGAGYTVTFIDVGVPQTGRGRNIELLERFKVKELKSTPAMFVVGPDGKLRNTRKDALSWRNAASRGPAATLDWFRKLGKSGRAD